jgi:hypothetical protein
MDFRGIRQDGRRGKELGCGGEEECFKRSRGVNLYADYKSNGM